MRIHPFGTTSKEHELKISKTITAFNNLATIKITLLSQYIILSIFTATILEWKHLLKPEKYKDVIIESLTFIVKEKRTTHNIGSLF